MSKTKRRRIQRDPQIQKRHRERFLAALASGSSPTRAAKQAGIGRSTLYEARSKDREFARAWADAVMEGIDRLEDEALRRATEGGSDRLLEMLLRRRRPEVYARHASEASPRVNVVVTLEEAKRRIRELGLPMLELEGDYEDAGKAGD
jgi:hypothetical protein